MHKHTVDLELAARLRDARQRAGLSQVVTAARSGLALGTVQKAEHFGAVSRRTLTALCRVLHLEESPAR